MNHQVLINPIPRSYSTPPRPETMVFCWEFPHHRNHGPGVWKIWGGWESSSIWGGQNQWIGLRGNLKRKPYRFSHFSYGAFRSKIFPVKTNPLTKALGLDDFDPWPIASWLEKGLSIAFVVLIGEQQGIAAGDMAPVGQLGIESLEDMGKFWGNHQE